MTSWWQVVPVMMAGEGNYPLEDIYSRKKNDTVYYRKTISMHDSSFAVSDNLIGEYSGFMLPRGIQRVIIILE